MASMLIPITNMMALKRRMAKMGPKKAPKKTLGAPMKQLKKINNYVLHTLLN